MQANAESVSEYTGTLSTIDEYMEKVRNGTFTIADAFEASSELGLDTSDIDFNGDWIEDFVNLIKKDAVDAFDMLVEKIGEVDPDFKPIMDQLEKMKDDILGVEAAVDGLNNTLNNMSNF